MMSGKIFVGEIFEFKSTATNVRKWDRTSVPTGHLRTQNGSNLRPKFGLSVSIRIKHETILSPISVRIRIGHSTAYTRVLSESVRYLCQSRDSSPLSTFAFSWLSDQCLPLDFRLCHLDLISAMCEEYKPKTSYRITIISLISSL
jgi:hypothetical protein